MQEKNSLNANLILKKIKKSLKISTDIQLSEFLNIKPNTISTWKKRNSLDYGSIISICELYEIDLNEIFFEKENGKKNYGNNYSSETPLICREMQFQYCIGDGNIENLPKYNFPFVRAENTRAFQVLGNNMSPVIEENSYVVCEEVRIEEIVENSSVVIVSKSKGLFINKFSKGDKPNTYILSSENSFFSPISISGDEINEAWLIKGILSYSINTDNVIPVAKKKASKPTP
jgi:transcriptional regulator with XRE-family HTH domain